MPKNSSPDQFARFTSLLAIGLTTIGLYFTYRNYSWQTQESLEERILVQLGFSQPPVQGESTQGHVEVDVVNIGLHPIYIRYAEIQPPNGCKIMGVETSDSDACGLPIYDRNRLTPNEHLKPLEPGDVTSFITKWDFSKFPLQRETFTTINEEISLGAAISGKISPGTTISGEIGPGKTLVIKESLKDHLWVRVDTTKKSFRQHPILSRVEISGSVPQERRPPAKK